MRSRVRINLRPLALTDAKFLLPLPGSVLGFNWVDLCTFSSSIVAVVDSRGTLMIPVCLLSQWRLQKLTPPVPALLHLDLDRGVREKSFLPHRLLSPLNPFSLLSLPSLLCLEFPKILNLLIIKHEEPSGWMVDAFDFLREPVRLCQLSWRRLKELLLAKRLEIFISLVALLVPPFELKLDL